MEWWVFSKKERGAIILILFIVVVSLCLKYSGVLSAGRGEIDERKIVKAISQLRVLDSLDSLKNEKPSISGSSKANFKVSTEERINRYASRANKDSLYPRNTLPDRKTSPKNKKWNYKREHQSTQYSKKALHKVSVSTADTTLLKTVRGIGSYFSKKIVSYRESLGGYHSITQLLEIYKMDSSRLVQISPFLSIDTPVTLQTISINTANVEKLGFHPYVSFKQAKSIVKYRTQHGDFSSVDDLLNIITLDQSWLLKVRMYLTL